VSPHSGYNKNRERGSVRRLLTVLPKRRVLKDPNVATSQNTALFIVTAVKTSTPAYKYKSWLRNEGWSSTDEPLWDNLADQNFLEPVSVQTTLLLLLYAQSGREFGYEWDVRLLETEVQGELQRMANVLCYKRPWGPRAAGPPRPGQSGLVLSLTKDDFNYVPYKTREVLIWLFRTCNVMWCNVYCNKPTRVFSYSLPW
jgi:hypothetical protein